MEYAQIREPCLRNDLISMLVLYPCIHSFTEFETVSIGYSTSYRKLNINGPHTKFMLQLKRFKNFITFSLPSNSQINIKFTPHSNIEYNFSWIGERNPLTFPLERFPFPPMRLSVGDFYLCPVSSRTQHAIQRMIFFWCLKFIISDGYL